METTAETVRLAREPEGGKVDLGGGDFFEISQARVRVRSGGNPDQDETPTPVPVGLDSGTTTFGSWKVLRSAVAGAAAMAGFGSPWDCFIDRSDLALWIKGKEHGAENLSLQLRAWQAGDRVQPLGMGGSKKLQDVFTDAGIPASRRRFWPILVVGETVLWVPGVVRSRHLLVRDSDNDVLRLQATPPFPI